jgi:hypothetical protein
MSQTAPTREQWKALYDLSEKFRHLECWQWMTDEQLFGVRNPKTGETGYCCIIGNLGQELGLIVYTGTDGLASYQQLYRSQNPPDKFEDFVAQKCLSVTYDSKSALAEEDLAVINELGLAYTGTRAYPAFRNLSPGYFPWLITADDADFLCVLLGQAMEVCLRCRDNKDLPASRQPGLFLVRVLEASGDARWTDQWLAPDPLPVMPEVPLLIDEVRLARIKASLKKARTTWEFAYAIENMPIKEAGRPYYPLLLLIADTLSGLILDNQMTAPHSYQGQLVERFLQAVEKAGVYPQEILVEKDEAMRLLQPIASRLEIKLIKVRKCKESAKARMAFREHLSHSNS